MGVRGARPPGSATVVRVVTRYLSKNCNGAATAAPCLWGINTCKAVKLCILMSVAK